MNGYIKITRKQFYNGGGFSNPRNVRVARNKSWSYYYKP